MTCWTGEHPVEGGVKVQKGVLRLRASWFIAILNCAYALCICLAQPNLLGICLAAAWQAKPLITSATERSLRIVGWPRIHSDPFSRERYQVKWAKYVRAVVEQSAPETSSNRGSRIAGSSDCSDKKAGARGFLM